MAPRSSCPGRRRAGLSVRADRFARSGVPGDRQFRRHPALQPVAPLRAGRGAAAQPPAGPPGLATPWPTDDPGLSRAQIKELQDMLYDFGHDVGVPDGIPGAKTREAVRAEQERATCRRTAAWASASTTRSRPHGRRWPRRAAAEPARPAMTRVSGTQGYGEHAMALAERYEHQLCRRARRSGPPDPAGAGPHRGHRRRLGPGRRGAGAHGPR